MPDNFRHWYYTKIILNGVLIYNMVSRGSIFTKINKLGLILQVGARGLDVVGGLDIVVGEAWHCMGLDIVGGSMLGA